MKREDVEKIALGTDKQTVIGLPSHLKAKISHSGFGYQYHLTRKGDTLRYTQRQGSHLWIAFGLVRRLPYQYPNTPKTLYPGTSAQRNLLSTSAGSY